MSSLENSTPGNPPEEHQPLVNKYARFMPPLYAFRMAALHLGAISMAQGSPLNGPNPLVTFKVATQLIKAACREFLHLENDMAGYLEYGKYQKAKSVGIQFLKELMHLQAEDNYLEDRINIGGYARVTLQNFLKVLMSPGQHRAEDRFVVGPGCWPLIFNIADQMGVKYLQTKSEQLDFKNYQELMDNDDATGMHIFYFCDPNNPLGHKFTDQEIYDFLKDMHEYAEHTGKQMRIIADNAYWGWCNKEYIEANGFPSFTRVAEKLLYAEEIDVRPMLVEIFSLGKAMGLASTGGSIAFYGDSDVVIAAHNQQTSFQSLPGFPQMAFIVESCKRAIKNPGFIIHRADSIHKALIKTHTLINEYFSDQAAPIQIVSHADHGPYITLKLDVGLYGTTAQIQGKPFTIRNPHDLCAYLLEEHGVGITPLDQRDLPNCVRIFVNQDAKTLDEGVRRVIKGIGTLVKNNPFISEHFKPAI